MSLSLTKSIGLIAVLWMSAVVGLANPRIPDEKATMSVSQMEAIYHQMQPRFEHQEEIQKPFLILFSGTQGMGKTFLARKLEQELNATRFSTNVMRSLMTVHKIPHTRANTRDFSLYFLNNHFNSATNKLVIFDSSVNRYWPDLKIHLEKNRIPYFFIRIEIPKETVMQRLMERNDFGLLHESMEQYFSAHECLKEKHRNDFSAIITESVRLPSDSFDNLTKAIKLRLPR